MFSLLMLPAPCTAQQAVWGAYLDKAREPHASFATSKEFYLKARDEMERARVEPSQLGAIELEIANLLVSNGDVSGADGIVSAASIHLKNSNPNSTKLLYLLGRVKQEKGKFKDAETFYRKALSAPEDSWHYASLYRIAEMYRDHGKREESFVLFRQAIDGMYRVARASRDYEVLTITIEMCRTYIKVQPQDLNVYAILADGLISAGKLDEAKNVLESVKADRSENDKLCFVYAELLFREGKFLQAVSEVSKGIDKKPSVESYLLRAECLAKTSDYLSAKADFQKVLDMEPENTRGWLGRSQTALLLGNTNDSISDAGHIIAKDSKNFQARLIRGRAYFEIRRYDLAISDYDLILRDANPPANAYKCRAEALYELRRYEEAKSDLMTFMAKEPNEELSKPLLLNVYLQSRDYQKAVGLADELLSNDPNDWRSMYAKGFSLMLLGSYEGAIEAFNSCLKIDSSREPMRLNSLISHCELKKQTKK